MNLVFSFLGFYVPNIEEDEMLETYEGNVNGYLYCQSAHRFFFEHFQKNLSIKLNNLFFYIDVTDRMFKSANNRNN